MRLRRVLKFPLEITLFQQIKMPKGALIQAVQMQRGTPTLWAEVSFETDEDFLERAIEKLETETRSFAMVATGYGEIPRGASYLGTVQQEGGLLVWHFYETFEQ